MKIICIIVIRNATTIYKSILIQPRYEDRINNVDKNSILLALLRSFNLLGVTIAIVRFGCCV